MDDSLTWNFEVAWSSDINDVIAVLPLNNRLYIRKLIYEYTVGIKAGNVILSDINKMEAIIFAGHSSLVGVNNSTSSKVQEIAKQIKSILEEKDSDYGLLGDKLVDLWKSIIQSESLTYSLVTSTLLVAIISYYLCYSYFIVKWM